MNTQPVGPLTHTDNKTQTKHTYKFDFTRSSHAVSTNRNHPGVDSVNDAKKTKKDGYAAGTIYTHIKLFLVRQILLTREIMGMVFTS